MTTFDRVKRNLLRDMDSCKTHTAESWAHIMLKNTNRLADPAEQTKFWEFMQNPTGEEHMPPPVCEPMDEHAQIETPDTIVCPVLDDETSSDVVMENKYFRNGMAVFIQSKPANTGTLESSQSPADPLLIDADSDEKIDSETL